MQVIELDKRGSHIRTVNLITLFLTNLAHLFLFILLPIGLTTFGLSSIIVIVVVRYLLLPCQELDCNVPYHEVNLMGKQEGKSHYTHTMTTFSGGCDCYETLPVQGPFEKLLSIMTSRSCLKL